MTADRAFSLFWLVPLLMTSVIRGYHPPVRHATVPAVSPDGRRIAYISENKGSAIFIIDAEGRDTYRVTPLTQYAISPAWSADSKDLIYSTVDRDTVRLWSITLPERDKREIWYPNRKTIFSAVATDARISNNGRRVVYASGDWRRSRLVFANLDGSEEIAIADSLRGFFNMAWSPDDRRIAVTRLDSTDALQVWVMNADGSEARPLTHFKEADGRPRFPAWSPDGKRIAIQSNWHNRNETWGAWIWIIDVATGTATKITASDKALDKTPWSRLDETPSWFPDGQRLAFQSDRSDTMEVWTMRVDGSDVRRLTR